MMINHSSYNSYPEDEIVSQYVKQVYKNLFAGQFAVNDDDIYGQTTANASHPFVIPPSLRKNGISLDKLRFQIKSMTDHSENSIPTDRLFVGMKAIDCINEYHDSAYNNEHWWISTFTGFNGEKCFECHQNFCEFYPCDQIYGYPLSWIELRYGLCAECKSQCCDYSSDPLNLKYAKIIQKFTPLYIEMTNIIIKYLTLPFTFGNDATKCDTSIITEWICVAFFECDSASELWFLNCNPKSKFYGLVYNYKCDGGNDHGQFPISIEDLI